MLFYFPPNKKILETEKICIKLLERFGSYDLHSNDFKDEFLKLYQHRKLFVNDDYKKRSIMLQNNRDKGTCELHRTISIAMKRLEADGRVKTVKKPGVSYSHYILRQP